ncbi:pyridoxamine kinase [Desulfovibrio sp. OttesenSCG-928-F20]|nr:pyridoxamine kinase [Desulfovibrio sp. OttesenSCG-928-F20]
MPPTPRLAAIHDLAGFGRTSLMVVIPIFSTLGIQVCPLPTAVLSTTTTGFSDFRFADLTDFMPGALAHWKELGVSFDAVYSGFLGSERQTEIVLDCIANCLKPGGLAVVDPVLGDNGKLEPTMDMSMARAMRRLTRHATMITPNLTEAALLLGEDYPAEAERKGMDDGMLRDWLLRLTEDGPDIAVITSVPEGNGRHSAVVAYQRCQKRFWKVDCDYLPAVYPGTGDTFTSVLTGSMMQGDSLPLAMDRAVSFVTLGIRAAFGHIAPSREGIALERALGALNAPVTASGYALWEEDDDR